MPRASYDDALKGFDAFMAKEGKNILGRDLTDQERSYLTSQVIPVYQDEWNGLEKGNSTLANLLQNLSKDPESKRKAAEGKASDFAPQVTQLFQSALGRAPTDQEAQHFGTLFATGDMDSYELGQFLQQSPEAQNAADKSFRGGLTSELQAQDESYYKDKILPAITNSLTAQGRSVDSSAYAAMLANAAKEQNTNREGFLANLSASQYGGNKASANADYGAYINNYYATQNFNRDQYANSGKRLQEIQDYNTQQQSYDKYLKSMGRRSGFAGAGAGAAAGASLGSVGGPWGAGIGAVGGGIAGYFGSQIH